MGRPGPARQPNHLAIVQGNPSHRTKADLARGIQLPRTAPPEPDWSIVFPPRTIVVPRRRKNETEGDRDRREALVALRAEVRADAKLVEAEASRVWRWAVSCLAPAGVISEADALVLEDLGVVWVRILQAERDVSRNGLRQKGERGWQRNGSVTTASQYRGEFRWLCGQLGLSPAARDFLLAQGGPGAPDGDDDFDV